MQPFVSISDMWKCLLWCLRHLNTYFFCIWSQQSYPRWTIDSTSCCCCCCHDEAVRHCLYGGQRCPEEIRNSTRLWMWRDPSFPRDSWQPFYWLGHHSRAAVVAHSWRIVDHCQTIDVDGCRQTVKLQSVLRLCSGFYRSKDPTNSI